MRPTRRYWTTAGIALGLAVGAVVFDRPLVLAGSAGVWAWLLAKQYCFVRAVTRLDGALSVEQSVTPERVGTGEGARVAVAAELAERSPLTVRVAAVPPVGASVPPETERTVELSPDDREGTTTFALSVPVAGTFTFDAASVAIHGSAGLFQETFDRGSNPTLTVEPRTPRNVHVGQGGEELAAAFGRHRAGRMGSGLEPAELREYVAGDAAKRIDWKATARLDHPYVREYEAETDRITALLVDHRAAMVDGPAGETKLAYAREVALTVLATAHDVDDPVGLFTVGDSGLTGRDMPEASPDQYATVRRRLLELAPTEHGRPSDGRMETRTPAAAGAAGSYLADDDSPFGSTLRPFFEDAAMYVQRISTEPLFETARTVLSDLDGSLWTVILTDDTNRVELLETVKVARRGDDRVLVFLTPDVLFQPGGLADLEAAYDRYRQFEEFRRSLARLRGVDAYEVRPGDQISTILAAHRGDDRSSSTHREQTGSRSAHPGRRRVDTQ